MKLNEVKKVTEGREGELVILLRKEPLSPVLGIFRGYVGVDDNAGIGNLSLDNPHELVMNDLAPSMEPRELSRGDFKKFFPMKTTEEIYATKKGIVDALVSRDDELSIYALMVDEMSKPYFRAN